MCLSFPWAGWGPALTLAAAQEEADGERGLGRACRCTALESFTQHILWSFKGLSRGRGDTGFL